MALIPGNQSSEQFEIEKKQEDEAGKTALLLKAKKKLLRRTVSLSIVIGMLLLVTIVSAINFYNPKELSGGQKDKNTNKKERASLNMAASQANNDYLRSKGKKAKEYLQSISKKANDNTNEPVNEETKNDPTTKAEPKTLEISPPVPYDASEGGKYNINSDPKHTENSPVLSVDITPEYPGGKSALKKFIMENLEYPETALKNKIRGIIKLKFIISASGSLEDVDIISDRIGYGLEEAAIAVIKKMPSWKPAEVEGKKVSYYYTLPISFAPPADE